MPHKGSEGCFNSSLRNGSLGHAAFPGGAMAVNSFFLEFFNIRLFHAVKIIPVAIMLAYVDETEMMVIAWAVGAQYVTVFGCTKFSMLFTPLPRTYVYR